MPPTETTTGLKLPDLLPDLRRHLKAKRRSERTVHLYMVAADRFVAWLIAEDRPPRSAPSPPERSRRTWWT